VTQRSSVRSRTPLIIAAVVIVVVAIAGLVAVLATQGGDDDADGDITYGEVQVDGTPLPTGQGPQDPSIGTTVPTITGTDYSGKPVTITPGKDGPLMIVVMAHWCPHCNNEIPKLVEWGKSGNVPDSLKVVGISTAAASGAPHFPPHEWLTSVGWEWPVIADDEDQTAAAAVGTTAYPFLMFVDAKGQLMFRISGELPIEDVQQLADAAAATAP
jgi:cytochrome c biogenesis protein CcmG, thiol:disulfide interchange protein DsbE